MEMQNTKENFYTFLKIRHYKTNIGDAHSHAGNPCSLRAAAPRILLM